MCTTLRPIWEVEFPPSFLGQRSAAGLASNMAVTMLVTKADMFGKDNRMVFGPVKEICSELGSDEIGPDEIVPSPQYPVFLDLDRISLVSLFLSKFSLKHFVFSFSLFAFASLSSYGTTKLSATGSSLDANLRRKACQFG